MKTLLPLNFLRFLLVFFLFANVGMKNGKAQMVYIPDSNFRATLSNFGYGSCIIGDSIDSSCPLITNQTVLGFLNNNNIYDLQGLQAFVNIRILNCEGNHLSYLPALPGRLRQIKCGNNNLTNMPSLPDSLNYLDVSVNQLTSLPALPDSLRYLQAGGNQLTSLPALPNGLTFMHVGGNQLTILPSLPDSLNRLEVGFNPLTSLPTLPPLLNQLGCSWSPISSLPALPNSIHILIVDFDTNLTSLPSLPDSLVELSCLSDHLTSLPTLPGGLVYLFCRGNLLTTLPALPNTITEIWCNNNLLTSLPPLPSGLGVFKCDHNQLTSLPSFLPSTYCCGPYFDLSNNLLTSIPPLPPSMGTLICDSNPNLDCLPRLGFIYNLSFVATGVTCLPNYGTVYYPSNPSLSSLPLCGYVNPNGCNTYWNISGKTFFDSNNNCTFDSIDAMQRNLHLFLYYNNNLVQQTFAGGDGFYSFDVGNYSLYQTALDTTNLPFDLLCPANNVYNDTINSVDSLDYDRDFALKCKPGFDIGAMSVAGWLMPAHFTSVHINAGDLVNFYGAHCAHGVSGSVTIIIDGPASYVSPALAALTPSTVSGDTLSYTISDFGLTNLFTDFNIIVQTDTFALNGDQVCFSVFVLPVAGDNNPANNSLSHCLTVHTSYDPNEKEVYPINGVDINGDQWLTYTIHFQNTGTALAENIFITDTLHANFNLSTFQLLAYSFEPVVQVLNGGVVRFNFLNINLPDSNTNEPASHGYVQYKIKLKNGLAAGAQVSNTAFIYFDYNAPVATNTTSNTLQLITHVTPVSKAGFPVSIYPNPAHDKFTIYCPQFPASKKIVVKIFDLLGKEMISKEMYSPTLTWSTAGLSKGIYFVEVISETYSEKRKLVVE